MGFVVRVLINLPGGYGADPDVAADVLHFGYSPARSPAGAQSFWDKFNQEITLVPAKNGAVPSFLEGLNGGRILGKGNCAGRHALSVGKTEFAWLALKEQWDKNGNSRIGGQSVQRDRPATDFTSYIPLVPTAS